MTCLGKKTETHSASGLQSREQKDILLLSSVSPMIEKHSNIVYILFAIYSVFE